MSDLVIAPRELTFGEQLVGVKFNPSGLSEVDQVKAKFAELADIVNNTQKDGFYLNNMLKGEALREIKSACMWTVGFLTS